MTTSADLGDMRGEGFSEPAPALLLHLDDEERPSPAEDEVELVGARARVRLDEAVSAKSIVAKSATLAAVHAARSTGTISSPGSSS